MKEVINLTLACTLCTKGFEFIKLKEILINERTRFVYVFNDESNTSRETIEEVIKDFDAYRILLTPQALHYNLNMLKKKMHEFKNKF